MATGVSGVVAAQRCSLSKLQSLNGLFAIYKKQGPTSADVLNQLKRKLFQEAGEKQTNPRKRKKQALKMGHGGTLDSAASGVLVVGVGGGTKMLTTMLTGSKKYTAVGELGKATDTLDATGTVTLQKTYGKTKHITKENMEEKLKKFTGEIMQVPPLYSALKRDGQRLSVLLKKGQEVEAKPARAVTVYHLSLRDFSPPLFTIELSSCAHVKELVRTKQGQFTLEEHALREDQWTIENIARVLQATPTEPVAESSAEPCPAARPRKDGEEQQGDDQGS
ncbi:putative tRNA pseudouridine synthase 1 [Scleropages formosus]|uniref:tRNA pseudouridine(55) synthase n=1 Tax=Scleropages formosus TaxID=113540 RepID=A0A0P7XCF5_SCLFO|nr:putative tRNA pseudouridine synthase 1 [Scleropages formosus]